MTSFIAARLPAAGVAVALLAFGTSAYAGYAADSYIDGCQSLDGRYVVTAELVEGKQLRGPFKWKFVWKDTKTGKTIESDAQGVQGGQVYAQLFLAPDGETFALFNHVIMWWPGESADHAHEKLPKDRENPAWREQDVFKKRHMIYRKDGTLLKEFAVGDFLQPEEWSEVAVAFNRVHWISDYPGLSYRKTPRSQYAFYQATQTSTTNVPAR